MKQGILDLTQDRIKGMRQNWVLVPRSKEKGSKDGGLHIVDDGGRAGTVPTGSGQAWKRGSQTRDSV